MPFFKSQSQSQYWALFVCILLVAALSKFQGENRPGYFGQAPTVGQSQNLSSEQLRNAVSGSIGIDGSRGDSVYVITR